MAQPADRRPEIPPLGGAVSADAAGRATAGEALFDLTAGFVYSQILSACVGCGLFEHLEGGARDLASIAGSTGLPPGGAERLLKAAAALKLVEIRSGGLYALGTLGAAMIRNDGVGAMVRHHALLYADLADPLALLAGRESTALASYWAYAGGARARPAPSEGYSDYTALMAASQALVADEILDAYPFDTPKALLDIGGGDGSFLMAVAKRAPALSLMLFDLPPVAAIARQRILAAGLAGRAKVVAGSFLDDPLPGGADLLVLNRILHDHDDSVALAILKAARAATPPGGVLLVAEPMSGTRNAEPAGDAYFGFYLLAMGQGRPRSTDEVTALLRLAGFASAKVLKTHTPLITRVIVARPA